MPKHEILHTAGTPINPQLRSFIEKFLGSETATRLERLGGKIVISVAAPFVTKKDKEAPEIIIDKAFVLALRELRDKPTELKARLAALSIKKLRELSKLIDHPVRTKSTRQEIVEEMTAHFYGEEIWRKISDAK